ncbi:type IV pilin-like G/H family protein [Kovacikia minuta CCNUW1]|uniref:type IV pilin-like G/H family protein n=1 Tax=Kovacikia minuta TaxID=2931930 RepID=UPI001CC9D8E7|nr:type IV pilin-like G/H family protein [Kovacikia minuta]UBF24636.1 type IV pilin-like G/H family protein [Kovacikia minuta CCNUW1]
MPQATRSLRCILLKGCLLLLLGCTASSNPSPLNSNQIAQVLVGRWQLQNKERSDWNHNDTLIFRADSSFIAINDGKAVRGRYWLRTDSFPRQIDLALAEPYHWLQGSFDLPNSKTLLLQRSQVGVTDPVRPTQVQANHAFNYRKVADSPDFPSEDSAVQDRSPTVAQREQSAKGYVIKMMFAQRAYGDRNRTYATYFQQIHPGLYDEDIDYRYRLIVKAPNWIWITAQAKYPELKSFTGQVIAGNVFSCATNQAASQPPSIIPNSTSIWGYVCDATSSEFRN